MTQKTEMSQRKKTDLHTILSIYEQSAYLIQIASCFRAFPMFGE